MKPTFVNQYEIIRRLGAGGGGVVYYANDTTLMRPVVVKMLHRSARSGEQQRRTVLREARLASAMEHPNVCAIYEVDESEGRAFIVMQYVPGRTLDRLVAEGPLAMPLVVSVAIQITDGLTAAHRLGILHRDLKPANIMLTDGGLVKILDFGLAKRKDDAPIPPGSAKHGRASSSRRGTAAYMAPEQYVTGQSSEQSDVFALGLVLYEMVTGVHPFRSKDDLGPHVSRAIQYAETPSPRIKRPDCPAELEEIILRALAKTPAARFGSAAEVREALRTVAKSLRLELEEVPGEVSAVPLALGADHEKKAGFFSQLAERFFGPDSSDEKPHTLAVMPFHGLGEAPAGAPFFGLALAEAVASRLARLPSITVRPTGALPASAPTDPLDLGRRLGLSHVLSGSYLHADGAATLTWQLLDVAAGAVRAGETTAAPSPNLVAAQDDLAGQVFASLRGSGYLEPLTTSGRPAHGGATPEEYLQARALLSKFLLRSSERGDLEAARRAFEAVLARDASFAPAHAALAAAHLQYVRKGFGGASHVLDAQASLDRALALDPGLTEAHLYRVETLLARGEKESARHGVRQLLESAPGDFDVRVCAGVMLQRDGLQDGAMHELAAALRLDPSGAAVVYNHRARSCHYLDRLELAMNEVSKGLALEPRHALLRTTLGYLHFRLGALDKAIATLEALLSDVRHLPMAYPTLAMCYLLAGRPREAAALLTDEALAAAEADGEMAYRLATYFAIDGDAHGALHWLRRAIYLGNENYPWFAANPAWAQMRDNPDYVRVLAELKKTYRRNVRSWSRLLTHAHEVDLA